LMRPANAAFALRALVLPPGRRILTATKARGGAP
jgi:hypothetical protein